MGNITWAFLTSSVSANWHPLTILSHMLDCQIYGLNPWGHHFTNVLLHVINTVLVFILLRITTDTVWRSFFVALLFAAHPAHVESVAWVSERKDVLSTCFGLIALICYCWYVKLLKQVGCNWKPFFYIALFSFSLGLMSKPMLVTLPFMLLLLDYWPLKRMNGITVMGFLRLVGEKIPYFILTFVVCIVTYIVQQQEGAMPSSEDLSFGLRAENALISYVRYIGKLFWPGHLAVFYPMPDHWPLASVVLSILLLSAITVALTMCYRRYPYMLMGWLWFIGTLIPVIGLVQVGAQAMADRYTYITFLGLMVVGVWGFHDLTRFWSCRFLTNAVLGSVVILLCFVTTRHQICFWSNSETLFNHAIQVTENNYVAHNNLGSVFDEKKNLDAAIAQYREAINENPFFYMAFNNMGNDYFNMGRIDDAVRCFRKAFYLNQDSLEIENNLGFALYKKGWHEEARRHFQNVLRHDPENVTANIYLGIQFNSEGENNKAIVYFIKALKNKPESVLAHNNLGAAYAKNGQSEEAIKQYFQTLRLKSDNCEANYNLGSTLYKLGRIDEALPYLKRAVQYKPNDSESKTMLANALALGGNIEGAITRFREVITLDPTNAVNHYNLALALKMNGETDASMSQYREAIQINPNYSQAHNNLGNILYNRGLIKDSILHFREAVRIDPSFEQAQNSLARALDEIKKN